MSRLFRLLPLLLLVAACGLVLPSCGEEDVGDVLSETFGPDKPIRSGNLVLAARLDLKGVQGLNGPVDIDLTGPFQSNGKGKLPNFDLALGLGVGGETLQAGLVSTGSKGYVKLQGAAFDVGKELYESFRTGYEGAQKDAKPSKDAPTFEALGIKPLRWLSDPQRRGEEEDVAGTKTIHIAAKVDVKRFLLDVSQLLDKAKGIEIQGAGKVPGGLTAKQRDQVARSVKSTTVDIWTGKDDKVLRKLRIAVRLDVPSDARKSVRGLSSGTIVLTLAINDLNEKQTIKAPRGARPLSELTDALQSGQAPGSGGSTTTPAQPPASAPDTGTGTTQQPSAPPAYLDCLEKAGNDIVEAQGCADLLQQ
jgi:hypothetical protein